jgi:hypothetical protein
MRPRPAVVAPASRYEARRTGTVRLLVARYNDAVMALEPMLSNLPGKLIAVDGWLGVGKTTFSRYLAWRFNISLCETDLFLIPKQGRLVYREKEISRIIARRLERSLPIIVDGCVVLRLLAAMKRPPDFLIRITNDQSPQPSEDMAHELAEYDVNFPLSQANIILHLDFS